MANTDTQIYLHVVFAVQDRACVIRNSWREQLHKYVTGIESHEASTIACRSYGARVS